MGKDKKEKNPMDAFRKEQRKKELLKLKKDREVVKGVRDLLNDPRKIDEEIAKAQKISDENKLDKTLKDKIKELQRMKDVANTRQLVLAAQGKKSLEEAESIIKPSIYQKNDGVWDDPSAKKATSHGHLKSASRISTEGLAPYTRAEDANLATQMPLPTSVMMPYPPALIPNAFPRGLPGAVGMMPGGPVMGGMAGIPLPPPRPMPGMVAPYNHLAGGHGLPRGYPVPPPPPPLAAGSSSQSVSGSAIPPLPGPPPGPPPGYSMAQFAPGFPGQVPYGYPPMGMPQPVPGMYGYVQPPFQQHFPHQQVPRGAPRPHQQQKERKPRPPRGTAEEVDPLDPAAQGYTERFGAAVPAKQAAGPTVRQEEAAPMVLPAAAPVPAPLLVHEDVTHEVSSKSDSATTAVEEQTVAPAPVAVPAYATYGALSAEELMRRRHTIPDPPAEIAHIDEADGPLPGPLPGPSFASASFSYPTLSAEELLRRRHHIPDAVATVEEPEESFVPARPPANYGAVLSAEELMRRRHMVQAPEPVVIEAPHMEKENAESYGMPQGPSRGDAEELLRRRFEIPEDIEANDDDDEGPIAGPSMGPGSTTSAEELLRQKYEIPEYEVEDVDSDEENMDDGYKYRDQGGAQNGNEDHGDVSDDEVRSAGQPEPFYDEYAGEGEGGEEEETEPSELNLNLRNLYPARLPASFTALPLPRSFAVPSLAPAPAPAKAAKTYSSAINFADYGDDDESDGDNHNEEEEESYPAPIAPKIQPYASAGPQAPAMLPARAPENFPVSSYYPEGLQLDPEDQVISHAVVKGPKIIKADRALTAFVPNALKKKRLLSSVAGTNNASFTSYRKSAATSAVEVQEEEEGERYNDFEGDANNEGEEDGEDEHARKAARHALEQQRRKQQQRELAAASLHAATSALFRPSSAANSTNHASSNVSSGAPARAPIVPIAFVAATTTTKKVPAAAPVDDDMALFFSEINQLEGV